jgi:hypothetical protein
MTDDRFEERLRRTFAELRAVERRVTPPLERVLRRPSIAVRRRVQASLAWTTAALTMLVIATVWLASRSPSSVHTERVLADWQRLDVSSWGSPTRFLLDTPDRAVLTGVPHFRQAEGLMPALRDFPMMRFPSTNMTRRNDS